MPRTALTLYQASDVGAQAVPAAPSVDGGIMPPDALLFVRNLSGAARTVTVQTPAGAGVPSGLDLSDRVLVVGNNSLGVIGPFPPQFYARPTAPDQGQVYVDFDSVTNVTAVAVQLPARPL